MSLPNPKELKKLIALCRKTGIKSFKNADFEFTLTDSEPVVKKNTTVRNNTSFVQQDDFETDSLTNDQMLFWSADSLSEEDKVAS